MGGPKLPPPSATEVALQGEQLQLTRLQREQTERMLRMQNLLEPYIFREMGLRPQYADGQLTGFEEIPRSEVDPLYDQRQEIDRLLVERSLAGLRGELPVSPGLLTDLSRQEETLRETLRRGLGEGYELSTPGARRLEEFNLRRNQLLEEARRGDITLGEQLEAARMLGNQQLIGARIANVATPYQLFGGFGSTYSGQASNTVAQGLSYQLGQRELQFQAAAQRSAAMGAAARGGAKIGMQILGGIASMVPFTAPLGAIMGVGSFAL